MRSTLDSNGQRCRDGQKPCVSRHFMARRSRMLRQMKLILGARAPNRHLLLHSGPEMSSNASQSLKYGLKCLVDVAQQLTSLGQSHVKQRHGRLLAGGPQSSRLRERLHGSRAQRGRRRAHEQGIRKASTYLHRTCTIQYIQYIIYYIYNLYNLTMLLVIKL